MEGSGGSSGRYDDEPPRRGALSPIRAGAVALALLLIAGSIFFLATRSDSEPPAPLAQQTIPTIEPSVNEPLTESEAIAIFEELDRMRLAMYRNPDPSLTNSVFAPGTKIAKTVRSELKRLERDGVSARSDFRTERLSSSQLDKSLFVIRQMVIIRPKFIDKDGNDVTGKAFKERQTIEWRLRTTSDGWRIAAAEVLKAKRV